MSRVTSAGSSLTDLIGVVPVVKLDGGEPPVWRFPELAGTQTFKAGEMVCLSGGTGSIGLTVPPTDASGFGILGFAADDAAGTTSAFKGVYIASPNTIFVANMGHSSVSANAQTAASDLGRAYGLTSLSGRTYIDKLKTSASTLMCRVVGLHEQDAVPSFYGRAYFTVIQPACQLFNTKTWNTSSQADLII